MDSIWTKTAQMPEFAPLQGDIKTDVLVIGGGIAGLLTAYAMQEAGIGCVLVEARRLCGGVTADTTAKITSQHGLLYAKLLKNFGRYGKRTRNLYVATGFGKWGMTSAMAASTLLRDLVLGKKNPWEDLFSPTRPMYLPQLAANALEAAKNLLTLSRPRCPHLGCALKWNRQEQSWDCPCHGSRFDADGSLLQNPATGDLQKRP